MRYVTSDIHGHFDLFLALLRRIGFTSEDELFICGDVLDKGRDCVRLLAHIAAMPNAVMIRGNHEESFLTYYSSLMQEHEDYGAVMDRLREYFGEDGRHLTWELVDYLEGLPYYVEEDAFICVHAGVPLTDSGELLPLEGAMPEELIYDRRFRNPDVLPKGGKCVFYGHTSLDKPRFVAYARVAQPTSISDLIKVQLDVGTLISGVLGCFCIDTLTAHYVTVEDC